MGESLQDQLVITNDTKHLMVVREFVSRLIQKSDLPSDDENKIILAVDEAVSNIMEHGYDKDGAGKIEVEVEADDKHFCIMIRDTGKVFNPDAISDPDIAQHVATGKKRGLGIFLMRQIMDEVEYSFRDGVKNELKLVKYIS